MTPTTWHIAEQAPFEVLLDTFEAELDIASQTRTCETCGREVELDEDDQWVDADTTGVDHAYQGLGGGRLVFCHDQDETHDGVRHSARV